MKQLVFFVIFIFTNIVYGQYQTMSSEEMIIRKFRASKELFFNTKMIGKYMERFDSEYPTYKNDEFELQKKEAQYVQYLSKVDNEIRKLSVFYVDFEENFGNYDFSKSEFIFDPFGNYNDEDGTTHKHIATVNTEYSYQYSNLMRCAVDIRNLDFVKGIKMESGVAQAFLKNRTTARYSDRLEIDRKVYIRIYYVAYLDRMIKYQGGWSNSYNMPDNCLQGEPLCVEVWGDKCKTESLLASFMPDSSTPEQFVGLRENLRNNLRNMSLSTINYFKRTESNNFKYLLHSTKYNKDCAKEYIELHIKMQHLNAEQNILQFRLFTNYNYGIFPGFIFNFFNKETNTEFPLVIYSASVEDGIAVLKVKVTDKTRNQIINSNCTSIKLQLTGSPKYSIPGGGVGFTKGFDWDSPEIWFYSNDQIEQTLTSILKNN